MEYSTPLMVKWLRWPQHSSQTARRNWSRSRRVASQRTPSSIQWGRAGARTDMWAVFRAIRRPSRRRGFWAGRSPVRSKIQRIRCWRIRSPDTVCRQMLHTPAIVVLVGMVSPDGADTMNESLPMVISYPHGRTEPQRWRTQPP